MSDPDPPEDPGEESDPELAAFAKQGRGVREVLQAVEDALMDAGYDDFVVVTEHGSFHWRVAPADAEDGFEED